MRIRTINGVQTTYGYDAAGQLASESRPGFSATYAYDRNGNRTRRTVNGATDLYSYTGDRLDSVSRSSGGTKSYVYDAAGRPSSIVGFDGVSRSLAWDDEDRLLASPVTPTSVYNGDGARVVRAGVPQRRAGSSVTSPVLNDGPGRRLVPGFSERTEPFYTLIRLDDRMGTTNHLSDASGNVLASTLETDAFGVETYRGDPSVGPPSRSGFAGGWGYEGEGGGLSLVGNRWYDADAGRFLTRDPARDGSNWWAYVANDPVNAVDPTGLVKIILMWYSVIWPGSHAGIIIIDNAKGQTQPAYSFSGGPERKGVGNNGKIVSKSGAWVKGTQDYGQWDGGGIVLVDDDSPAGPWIERGKRIAEEMARETRAQYNPVPTEGSYVANSNSWAREFISRMGLLDIFRNGEKKKPASSRPWLPGWRNDVWIR